MYLVRAGISSYYTYRISTATRRLEEYQLERTKTIDKLKTATKYNSTQQLLEKYGGATPAPKPKLKPSTGPGSFKHAQQHQTVRQPARTSIPPPATANIQRPGSLPSTPQQAPAPRPQAEMSPLAQALQKQALHSAPSTPQQRNIPLQPRAEFAPNAFSSRPSFESSSGGGGGGQWYDRILDVLLGEDETHPKNRVVLLCSHCRLVNGQAPPGVKRVEEVGEWRCFNCGGVNGKDEGKRMVEEIMRERGSEKESEKGEESEKSEEEGERRRDKEASEEVEVEDQIKAGLKEEEKK